MANPFLAEIRIFAGNFAPTGWALCGGQLMSISQNTALFSLLGTTYGGDGRVTFGLPNLQGSVPVGQGQGPGLTDRFLGEIGGEQTVTLITSEIPLHNHLVQGSTEDATLKVPGPKVYLGRSKAGTIYQSNTGSSPVVMNFQQLGLTGNSFPHQNMQPYLTLCFIVALQGVYPQRG
jgi:microcystin-dependent protein